MKKPDSFVFLLTGLLGLAAMGCTSSAEDPSRITPEEIRGVWVSDHPDYAGRKMEILEEAFIIHTGEGPWDPYIILNVLVEQRDDGISYEIEHRGWEGGSLTLSLLYRYSDSTMVFENQPMMVWRKAPSGT